MKIFIIILFIIFSFLNSNLKSNDVLYNDNLWDLKCKTLMLKLEFEISKKLKIYYPELSVVKKHKSYLSAMYTSGTHQRDCWIKHTYQISPENKFPINGKMQLVLFFYDENLPKEHWTKKLPSPQKIFSLKKFPKHINLNIGIIGTNIGLIENVKKWIENFEQKN